MKTRVVALTLMTLASSGAALAVDLGDAAQDQLSKSEFVTMDVNKDGYLEKNEVKSDEQLDMSFDRLAHYGKISESKYLNWRRTHDTTSVD